MDVLPLGVVHLVGVMTLGLARGNPADCVLLRLLAVARTLLSRVLNLGLFSAAFVGHGDHHTFSCCRKFCERNPTSNDIRHFDTTHKNFLYVHYRVRSYHPPSYIGFLLAFSRRPA